MGLKYLLKRLVTMVPVFFAVVTIVFFFIRFAPGGPFDDERKLPPEILENLNKKYHLDEPLWMQYGRYVGGLLQFDLGPSFKHSNRTVNEIIGESLPVSAELATGALLWALFLGLTAGGLAALKPNSLLDYIPMSISVGGICLPTFVTGPLAILVFGLWFEWLPVAGWDGFEYKILPSITLGTFFAAFIARLTRGGLMEIRTQDFIRTARAKGLRESTILIKHSLRGGLLPVVSFLGPAVAGLLSGSLVTETIFNIPGLGRFFIQSALNRDYTVVMGTTLVYFTLIFICNLIVDMVYVVLDPRVRYE